MADAGDRNFADAPVFTNESPVISDNGQASIGWTADGPVMLEMARDENFSGVSAIYRGNYDGYFISGLADGDYYLRLSGEGGAVSPVLLLRVSHSSLDLALWLMLAGFIVTIGIILTIWRGARDE